MLTEAEQQQLKEDNAALLREKADAVAAWHKEVRDTLKKLTDEIATIKGNTSELPQLRANLESLQTRVRVLEDFKTRFIAYIVLAFAFIAAFWKIIDRVLP